MMAARESGQTSSAAGPHSRRGVWRPKAVWSMVIAAACLLVYFLGSRFLLLLVGPVGAAVVGGAAAFLLARRLPKPSTKSMLAAFVVQAGQMAALAAMVARRSVSVIAGADYPPSVLLALRIQAVELPVLLVGLSWLLLRPGRAPVLFLIVYQWASYTVHTTGATALFHSSNVQAWSVYLFHVLLRGVAVWLMVSGLRSMRTERARPVPMAWVWCAIIGLWGVALLFLSWFDTGLYLLRGAYSPHFAMFLGPLPAAFATILLGRWVRDRGMHPAAAIVLAVVAWPALTLVVYVATISVLMLRYEVWGW
jgi:hypothetical protein